MLKGATKNRSGTQMFPVAPACVHKAECAVLNMEQAFWAKQYVQTCLNSGLPSSAFSFV